MHSLTTANSAIPFVPRGSGVCAVLMILMVSACTVPPLLRAPDGPLYASYYVPDAIPYAGNIHVYLRNPSQEPLTVTSISMDGKTIGKIWLTDESFLGPDVREEYIKVVNDQLAWYRVWPNPVPPGGVAEVILRLMPKACEAPRHELAFAFAAHEPLTVAVPMRPPASTLEYVALSAGLDAVHIYARGQEEKPVRLSRVEIDGRPAEAEIHPVFSGFSYAKVELTKPWERGSFHCVAVRAGRERRAALIRALPTPPPLGIMGNVSDREAEQYANHLFDANLAFTSVGSSVYDTLDKHGLTGAYIYYRRLKPGEKKYEPVFYDRPQALGHVNGRDSLWAYFLEDEPDGRYHLTSLPRAGISRDVERANQFCRIFDPEHPTYLQINHGGYPRNMYVYSQIPDYVCTHAYALGTDAVVKSTQDHVAHTQAASRPRPFYYLNCGYCRRGKGRAHEPDEMRLEVHTALACGAKSFQWYPAHGDVGLLKHPKMWNAVGEMNGVLHQVLPLVSIGMPVGQPTVEGGNILGSTILCGDKAMVVVLVNKDFSASPEKFEIRPVRVKVSVRLPRFMTAAGVCTVHFPRGLPDRPAKIDGSNVEFSVNVGAGAIAVIYADESVFEQMRQAHARCLERFKPMAER